MKVYPVVIIIAVILIMAIALGGYALYRGTQGTNGEGGAPTGFFASLFPFGDNAPPPSTPSDLVNEQGESGPAPTIRVVTDNPVSGAFATAEGTIRYMERETGHIYETAFDSLNATRLTNTTIPGTLEAVWLNNQSLIIRSLSDVGSYENVYASFSSSTPDQKLALKPLSGFSRIAPVLNGEGIVTIDTSGANAILSVSGREETSKSTVFSSPIRSWIPLVGGTDIFIQSAPAYNVAGFLYRIENAAKTTSVLSGILGLISLPSPDGRYIAYSSSGGTTLSLRVLDTETGTSYSAPLSTLASKCVWLAPQVKLFCGVPKNAFGFELPDEWLPGTASFDDSAWIIDPLQSTASAVTGFTNEVGQTVDIMNPRASADGEYVLFTNKTDQSLWSIRLTQ